LIRKVESIIDISNKFDTLCSTILSGNNVIDAKHIKNVRDLTKLYMLSRAEHGGILILYDLLKKDISMKDSTLTDKLINKLYDLSTFTSIIDNINNLISNMDFQYKKIALLYPKLINMEQIHLILFVDKINKENKYINIIEEMKQLKPEINYHVVECDKNNHKIDCSKMVNMKLSINVNKLPALYFINGSNVIELSLEKINSKEELVKMMD
jgi:hypothetical protein